MQFTNPQPTPLDADGADFRDCGDRILLASLGIFSIDKTSHINRRYGRKVRESRIDYAYQVCGIDRKAEYARIAGEVAPLYPEGIWPTSTGEYTRRRAQRDAEVLALAQEETT